MAANTDDATDTSTDPRDHLLITHEPFVKIRHFTPEPDLDEAGFDLTTFGDARTFRVFLKDVGLHPEADFVEVDKAPDEPDRTYRNFVWANEDLALITGNNPLTGEYSDPSMRRPEEGYASYVGLSGTETAVDAAFSAVKAYAQHIKEADRSGRQFI